MESNEYTDILESVILSEDIPASAKATYLRLLKCAGELGPCEGITLAQLAAAGVTENAVGKRLDKLAAAGVIDVARNPLRPVWIYHPVPEKRARRQKETPLFPTLFDDEEPADLAADLAAEKAAEKAADLAAEKADANTPIYPRAGADAGAGVTLYQEKERKKEAICEFDSESDSYRRTRDEVRQILIAVDDWTVSRELIDRATRGVIDRIDGLTLADLRRIRAAADRAVQLYAATDGARGKRYRWLVIAAEIGQRYKAAGLTWGPCDPTPEKPPTRKEPEKKAAATLPTPTLDEIRARTRGEEVPVGESLAQTARRLGVPIAEAVFIRQAVRKLEQMTEAKNGTRRSV